MLIPGLRVNERLPARLVAMGMDGRPPRHVRAARPRLSRLHGARWGALRANGWRARHWRPAIRAAGLEPLRPHDLRHTAVSLWVAAGASPKQIATWAGHTSVSVVLDRYGHLFPGHQDAVLDRLQGFGRNAPTTAIAADEPGVPRGTAGFPRGNAKDGSPEAPVTV